MPWKQFISRLVPAAALTAFALCFLAGCASSNSLEWHLFNRATQISPDAPIRAPILVDLKGPVAGFEDGGSGKDLGSNKVGKAKVRSILGFSFGELGEGSIKKAADEANIQTIRFVDSKSTNILGIYSEYTTLVYGE